MCGKRDVGRDGELNGLYDRLWNAQAQYYRKEA